MFSITCYHQWVSASVSCPCFRLGPISHEVTLSVRSYFLLGPAFVRSLFLLGFDFCFPLGSDFCFPLGSDFCFPLGSDFCFLLVMSFDFRRLMLGPALETHTY